MKTENPSLPITEGNIREVNKLKWVLKYLQVWLKHSDWFCQSHVIPLSERFRLDSHNFQNKSQWISRSESPRKHSVFWDQWWRQGKFKMKWSRSLVIGDNDVKKEVVKLILHLSDWHKSAFVFLKDYENEIHFVIWKSFLPSVLQFLL